MNTNYLELINEILYGSLKESDKLEFKDYKFENGKFNSLDSKNMNTLMKEICSFANADGGKIILGIAEDENHNPNKTSDTGVGAENFETWEQSFRNKIATKTIPAIYGIKLHHLMVEDNNCIIIDIPRSFLKPHAYDDGEHKFYIRNGNESRPMRYPELKNNFLALDSSQRKLLSFRDERISSILDGEVDDSLTTTPSLIIHIYPEKSIDQTTYGVCPYHLSFAGSINIGYEGLYLVLKGIVDSLMKQGVRKFLILNGHGGNTPSIDRASLDVYNNGGISTSIDWWSLIGELDEKFKGGHGDKVETSAMMAIDRNLVKLEYSKPINAKVPMDDVKANTIQTIKFKGGTVKFSRDTKEIAPSGWFGPFDPKDSTVEYGKEALDLARKFIKDFIEEYRKLEI